jgi:hypothetical protein
MDIDTELESARIKQAKERGLTETATWRDIMNFDSVERRKRLGLPPHPWRDDKEWSKNGSGPSQPTASFLVIHATDKIVKEDVFTLFVDHVNTFHGKGFRPRVKSVGSLVTGDVYYGVGVDAYSRAAAKGRELLQEKVRELAEEMERVECLRQKL